MLQNASPTTIQDYQHNSKWNISDPLFNKFGTIGIFEQIKMMFNSKNEYKIKKLK